MSQEVAPIFTGGCQCGQVRYRIDGTPIEPIAVCFCRMCQKAMGNVLGVFAPFKVSDVSWTKVSPQRFQSSSASYRLFCSNCGTPLAWMSIEETQIEMTVGTFDCPEKVKPEKLIGIESRISWTHSISNLPAMNTVDDNPISKDFINYQHPDHD